MFAHLFLGYSPYVPLQDIAWLALLNANRKTAKLTTLTTETFEYVMDTFEREAYRILCCSTEVFSDTGSAPLVTSQLSHNTLSPSSKTFSSNIKHLTPSTDVCCICRESQTGLVNGLLKCDNCSLLVHQDCYGVPYQNEGGLQQICFQTNFKDLMIIQFLN